MKNWERFGIAIMSLWGLLALHQLAKALLAAHHWTGMSAGDWGTWVGSIGTVGAFIGTIWLATAEERRRQRAEHALALVTIAGLAFRISIVKLQLDAIGSQILRDMTDGIATDYAHLYSMFEGLPIWTPEELVPLVDMAGHLAARLAFATAEIDGVKIGVKMAAGVPLYAEIQISRMFNAITLPRINAPIEVLIDCATRCRRYMDESGFSEQSPMMEL